METDNFNWPFLRPIVHRYNRRASWHDYHSRCIYMITITAAADAPWFSKVLGTPRQPEVVLTPTGRMIDKELTNLCSRYMELRVSRRVIMPDHLHFILNVTTDTPYHLGSAVASLKGSCTHQFKEAGIGDCLFAEGFHDRILRGKDQLETMHNYVRDNPRRLLIKRENPDLFRCRHYVTINGTCYEALGNIFLLRNPHIEQVKVSRRFTHEQLRAFDKAWIRAIEEDGVLVSPFISPAEKVYRDLAINNDGNLIIINETGFGKRYKPPGRFFDLCAEGRLLLIAPAEHRDYNPDITYKRAQELNNLAALIATGHFDVAITL